MLATFINSMSIQHVILTCQQIKQAGKKPTTALVKAKLGNSVPLAQVIRGIQAFAANPSINTEVPTIPIAETEKNVQCQSQQCKKKIKTLAEHVALLENTITSLQAQVLALTKP